MYKRADVARMMKQSPLVSTNLPSEWEEELHRKAVEWALQRRKEETECEHRDKRAKTDPIVAD